MRRLLILIVSLVLVLQSFTVAAEETTMYSLNISILDASGGPIDLSDSSFHIGVGSATANYEKGLLINGYSPENIIVNYTASGMTVQTPLYENINLTIYKEVNNELIHISDMINASAITSGTADRVYKLKELKKLSLSTSCQGLGSATYQCFLFKQGSMPPYSDDIMGSWCNLNKGDKKTIYVTPGKYNATFICTKGSKVYIYQKKDIDVTNNKTVSVTEKSQCFQDAKINISSIYAAYPYYQLQLGLVSGETILYSNSIVNNKVDIYIQKNLTSWKNLALSNNLKDPYNKSIRLNIEKNVKLGEQYYIYEFYASKAYDGSYIVNPFFKDLNGNVLQFIDIERPEKYYLEIVDSEGLIVHNQTYNSYWFTLNQALQEGNYTVKTYAVADSNCIYMSNIDLTVNSSGEMSFTFSNKESF